MLCLPLLALTDDAPKIDRFDDSYKGGAAARPQPIMMLISSYYIFVCILRYIPTIGTHSFKWYNVQ